MERSVGRHHVLCDVIVGDVALWMHYGMERKDGGEERGDGYYGTTADRW
jgi:hypothetical protein